MFVGREPLRRAIADALAGAREGGGRALVLAGEPGIGKSALLDEAERSATGFRVLRTTGVEAELTVGHAGLGDVLLPVRHCLDALPAPQRDAVAGALGWAPAPAAQPHLVAAGTLSLLAAAAAEQPVLLLVDDLHWLDRESATALTFAARRLTRDAVVALLATRATGDGLPAGLPVQQVTGLPGSDARGLVPGIAAPVADRLAEDTGGNPLALLEIARSLSPEQRRGAARLPEVLPVGDALASSFGSTVAALTPPARRTLLLAAAGAGTGAGTVVAALAAEGVDVEAALDENERQGTLQVRGGVLRFRHPLLRSAVWAAAAPGERRSAHRSLASALPHGSPMWARHLAEATVGHDEDVARCLLQEAAAERGRHGYAASAALLERAAQLTGSPMTAAGHRAAAVEDAFLAGDGAQVRRLAATVLDGPADDDARARARAWLGIHEQYAGSVHRARELLERAAEAGAREVRLHAAAELAQASFRLGDVTGMTAAAEVMDRLADRADPEQEMLACFVRGSALAFGGRWDEAGEPIGRAVQLLETDPVLRDDPRHLVLALVVGWTGGWSQALAILQRRLDAARAAGALGVLPTALALLSGGAIAAGLHDVAYAAAGEGVELGTDLGFVADVAICNENLAWQAAARGLHEDARHALTEARRLAGLAGTADAAVHIHHVEAFAALCRGDSERTIQVLERRIAVDEGRLARGDYPLAVAADLVEAYLATGRTADAAALAARHDQLHGDSPDPDVRGRAARLRGMVADGEDAAEEAFDEAHRAHADGGTDPFEAGRSRLAHGSRRRRTGRRTAAREQLEAAATAFRSAGLDGWTARAEAELAATGRTLRRGPQHGDQLTSQETRVALLVARGMTNREIAASLFLSPKTVEHHVTSVLRKRGLRSRTELAVAFS